jgi:hypothetical protein
MVQYIFVVGDLLTIYSLVKPKVKVVGIGVGS